MNQSHNAQHPGQLEDPREISKWTRVYAQNRTIPFVVFMLIFLLLCAAIGGGSCLVAWAYLSGNMLLFAASIVLLVLAIAADVYFAVPRWGGKRMGQIAQRLYAQEGKVALASPQTAAQRRLVMLAGLGFGVCIVVSVILSFLGYIPDEYMQPVSALYVVPFLVILSIRMAPVASWLMLLWPGLYALHAILIVAGAPILVTGHWRGLNMLIPVAGYGLLSGFVGHAYSRFALRRLKRLARIDLPAGNGQGEATLP